MRDSISTVRVLVADRHGGVAVTFALCLVVICGGFALAIDYARAARAKSVMQEALDSATIAVALHADQSHAIGVATFKSNAKNSEVSGATPAFTRNGDGSITGTVTYDLKTAFAPILGRDLVVIGGSATVSVGKSSSACIHLVSSNASQALLVNSGARLQGVECELHSHSTTPPAAIFNAGSLIDLAKVCLRGPSIIDNGGTHPNTTTGCQPEPDPLAGTLTLPASSSCTVNGLNVDGGVMALSPGVYCGWVNFNSAPTIDLLPGVYVIKGGGWNVNGGVWRGTGVTFYFDDTSMIQFNSAVQADLQAPTSGPYANILFFERPGLANSNFVLDDSRGFDFQGAIYLPSRNTTINSGATLRNRRMLAVFNTLILNDVNWSIQPLNGSSGAMKSTRLIR